MLSRKTYRRYKRKQKQQKTLRRRHGGAYTYMSRHQSCHARLGKEPYFHGNSGGAIHPGATVVFKLDNYAPFQMGTPEEAEELFETRNVYKL